MSVVGAALDSWLDCLLLLLYLGTVCNLLALLFLYFLYLNLYFFNVI